MKKTLVIGASPNPDRYAYKAVAMLKEYGHPVIAFGRKRGEIEGIPITNELPDARDFDTVTLYLNPSNQSGYLDFILNMQAARVIFNPGTENPEFEEKLKSKGIQPLEACTLVLLRTGQY